MNRPWSYSIDTPAYPFAAMRDWLADQGVIDALDDVEIESAWMSSLAHEHDWFFSEGLL